MFVRVSVFLNMLTIIYLFVIGNEVILTFYFVVLLIYGIRASIIISEEKGSKKDDTNRS